MAVATTRTGEQPVQLGDQLRVRLVERLSDSRARVIDVASGQHGILLIKGELRVRADGTVSAWLLQASGARTGFTCGNAYFGKFTISASLVEKYTTVIKKLYDHPTTVVPDEISLLKGMANRCLKKDQWDWFTTYQFLGYPAHSILRQFVADAVTQRGLLLQRDHSGLHGFMRTYHALLGSMLFHLSADVEVSEADVGVPVPGLDSALWNRLSEESRKNIKMAERIHAKSSLYTLMHYFVVVEQEFRRHLVEPFAEAQSEKRAGMTCTSERYQRTHDVLIGRTAFTLGTVRYLGEFVTSARACEASAAIGKYAAALGQNREDFSRLCAAIATYQIGGVPLPQLRNALAHGEATVISRLDVTAFAGLRAALLEPPARIIARVLSISLRQDGSRGQSRRSRPDASSLQ